MMKIKNQKGMSLIEILIATAIGLFIIIGILNVFDASSRLNKSQNGLARLQENGRFAIMQMKQNLEQAGYMNCVSTSLNDTQNQSPQKLAWKINTDTSIPGIPSRTQTNMVAQAPADMPFLYDPTYLMKGHECGASTCSPSLSELGSDGSITIPDIGTGDGDRIAGTDVLTFRYLQGSGVEIASVQNNSGNATLTFSPDSIARNTTAPNFGNTVLLANCSDTDISPDLYQLVSSTAESATVQLLGSNLAPAALPGMRLFGFENHFKHVTYYVANQVVDGRDIPTLYQSINGTVNALVEGIDKFDILYTIKTATGGFRIVDADTVENLDTSRCFQAPLTPAGFTGFELENRTGCGWRSVVSAEVHMLLNTRNDSSLDDNDPYYYLLAGEGVQAPKTNLGTGINHYKMMRKEFVATITLKNNF